MVGSSVAEDRQVELAKALGVGEQVDGDDLSGRDREAKYHPRLSARSPYESHSFIHQRRLCSPSTPRQGTGHGRRTADLLGCAHMHGCGVGPGQVIVPLVLLGIVAASWALRPASRRLGGHILSWRSVIPEDHPWRRPINEEP